MENQKGASLPKLIIIVFVIIVATIVAINYAKKLTEESKLQDLRTNMLLIQAETKKDLEAVCFQSANLDKNNENDLAKINEIKQENLKGVLVQGSEAENSIPTEITIDANSYYLDKTILSEMGIKDSTPEEYGYFIVKYNFDDATVEVVNTKGYNGKYTLTQLEEE